MKESAARKTIPTQSMDCTLMGSHAQHWQSFGLTSPQLLPRVLQDAVDHSGLARGLTPAAEPLPDHLWCLQDDRSAIGVVQLIDVDQEHPVRLCNAFPLVYSPHRYRARIEAITHCPQTHDAVLTLQVGPTRVFAFDPFYALNARHYQAGQTYEIQLSGLVHELEQVASQDLLEITDPEAIRYHRGLNAILAAHPDLEEHELEQQLRDWQPQSEEDRLPVTVDLSHMAAYLQGEQPGQEDEAWIAGKIIGQSQAEYEGRRYALYDVVVQRDEPQPLVIRVAQCLETVTAFAKNPNIFALGTYIRGNIWLQASVYAICEPNSPLVS